jgi:hypothetical protein
MKTFYLCVGCGAIVFFAGAFQLGLFDPPPDDDGDKPATAVAKETKAAPKTVPFPKGLLPALQGNPVPEAAGYVAGLGPHRMAIFKYNGDLHYDWQEMLDPEWQAESVRHTELVVMVGKDVKTNLGTTYYPNNAPPVTRYQYELEVRVIEPKTGRALVQQRFRSTPRGIRRLEAWELTALGAPVSFSTVFNWLKSQAEDGFRGILYEAQK